MAVSSYARGRVLYFASTGDSTSDYLIVQGFSCDDGATVKDGSGNVVWKATGSEQITFPCPLELDGLEFDAGTGNLWAYLK